jgi:hypothetical protein
MVSPFVGRPVAVTEVAAIECELYKLTDPAPVDPSQSEYVAPAAVAELHVNVAVEPVRVLPGGGDVMAA